jgi:hypothetical protein
MRAALLAIVLVMTMGACGGSSDADQSKSVRAQVEVELRYPLRAEYSKPGADPQAECAGALDYKQIQTGSPVVFADAESTTVETAELEWSSRTDAFSCIWTADASFESHSRFFTAEVGGWKSSPERVSGGIVSFDLRTTGVDSEGRKRPEVDSSWSRVGG